VISKIKQLKP